VSYRLTLARPNGKPSATLSTTSPQLVAATLEGWLDHAPAEWFDTHGELTVEITHHRQPISTAVLGEHIAQFRELTGDDEAIAEARRGNPKREGHSDS
jgi:hypothetical protein